MKLSNSVKGMYFIFSVILSLTLMFGVLGYIIFGLVRMLS